MRVGNIMIANSHTKCRVHKFWLQLRWEGEDVALHVGVVYAAAQQRSKKSRDWGPRSEDGDEDSKRGQCKQYYHIQSALGGAQTQMWVDCCANVDV